jgi:hypothetical protein
MFGVRFKNGDARVVAPDPEDPSRFIAIKHTQEGMITDANVRFLLARFGITDPTPGQYDEMMADLAAASRQRASKGDAALGPLEKKWEKRRTGPDQAAEVMAELKKRYRELGIE